MLPEMAPGRQGPTGAHFLGNGREHGGGGWWVGGSVAGGEDGKVWEMTVVAAAQCVNVLSATALYA